MEIYNENLLETAATVKLLLTDCDGVLTDTGIYYSASGEELKRFSVRDGMGVERLRTIAKVDVGIVSGENSPSLVQRAAKLKITELHCGCKDKAAALLEIMERLELTQQELAFIGDDVNDCEAMRLAGLSACTADAMEEVKKTALFQCKSFGGHGAFREFAEFIIHAKRWHAIKENSIFFKQILTTP
jgi:3-deoxy-D-manno-octulosonate 8-phosphate phosphatase (KDO 8-P phosphatase)